MRGDSPQYALNNLDPKRITAARERLGMTQRELSERIGKTPSAVSQFEQGVISPDLDTIVRLSLALGVPTTYFVSRRFVGTVIDFDACHFRSSRSASQKDRRRSIRLGEQFLELAILLIERGVVFPEEQLTSFQGRPKKPSELDMEAIEQIASGLRKHWGMGMGPIPNVTKLLESKGVFVLPIADAFHQVDAYSSWPGARPTIMLSFYKSASRARFDAAHELGHLIMHEDTFPTDTSVESQADRFASAFLAPREGFLAECPKQWSLAAFTRLKARWRMSIQALVRRAYDLGQLSRYSYSRAFRDLSKRGMRTDEGRDTEWPHEHPTLLSQALALLKDEISISDISAELDLPSVQIQTLLSMPSAGIDSDLVAYLDRPPKSEHANLVTLTP